MQRSLNRGASWSGDLITPIAKATNAALAISVTGTIGLMYQQLTGTAPSDRWETHFQQSTNGTSWTDKTVSSAPAETPASAFLPYIGDYLELVAVGKNFYGTFCANNTPDPANFPATPAGATNPNGALFGRNVTSAAPWNLLGSDGHSVVAVSIDPYFLGVVEVPASVRLLRSRLDRQPDERRRRHRAVDAVRFLGFVRRMEPELDQHAPAARRQ